MLRRPGTQLPGCSAELQLLVYRAQLEIADDAELPVHVHGEAGWE